MQLIGIICNFVNEELGKSLSIKLKSFKVMKKKIIYGLFGTCCVSRRSSRY